MNKVENMLNNKKLEMDSLEVPEELEGRLHSALNSKISNSNRSKKGNIIWKAKVAAVLIVMLFIGYNFDTFAFYGKKLIGYDGLMNSTLKQLNELGRGQSIEKSYTFKNGMTVTLDGVMADDNKLLAFYTITFIEDRDDNYFISPTMAIRGKSKTYMMHGSVGDTSNGNLKIKYIGNFETPNLSDNQLTLCMLFTDNGKTEKGEITFTLDRNKAMGHTLKKNINKAIKVDETKIRFKSILASPISTIIKGEVRNIVELCVDEIKGERFRLTGLDVKLIADGKELQLQNTGIRTDMNGITFRQEFEPLPADLKKLQIKLISFGADHDVKKKVNIEKNMHDESIELLGQKIQINNVYESNGDTYVTITTKKGVVLTRVHLIMDSKVVELKETILDEYHDKADGTTTHTRTLHFPSTGNKLQLDIKKITYTKMYNKIIDIPVN